MWVRTMALMIMVAGCTGGGNDALESTTSADLDALARTVEAVEDGSQGGSFDGFGDCVWNWSLTGTAYDAGPASTPCGGSLVGRNGSKWTYQVTGSELVGDVEADGTYDLTGYRDATLHLETARGAERDADASLTISSLVGTADRDGVAGPFSLEASYDGWADGAWKLSVDADANSALSGALTGPEGKTCAISGVVGDAELACD